MLIFSDDINQIVNNHRLQPKMKLCLLLQLILWVNSFTVDQIGDIFRSRYGTEKKMATVNFR